MQRWLHITLSAPLMSFGGVSVDHVGPTRDLPAASALTGLLANALGWRWSDRAAHQALQDRLVFGALATRQGEVLTDSQNARLEKSDKGWTTSGMPEGRAGASYNAPHRRRRDFLADAEVHVALRLDPSGASPTLDDLAFALDRPARPLFIGRKPCLPSHPLNSGWIEAADARAALMTLSGLTEPGGGAALWSAGEGEGEHSGDLPDIRNWSIGLHSGSRRVVFGRLG